MKLQNIKSEENTAFLFTAGGSRAAYQFGVSKGLKDFFGLVPNKIFGVSGGAINAALMSTLDYEFVENVWRNKVDESIIYNGNPFWRLLTLRSSFYSLDPLEENLNCFLKDKEFKIPASCIAICLKNGDVKEFHNSNDNFIRGVRASSSIPIVFDPAEIDNKLYVDGGVTNYSPMSFVIDSGSEIDNIVVVSSKPRDQKFEKLESSLQVWDMLFRIFPISREEMFNSDLKLFETINRLVGQANSQGFNLEKEGGEKYKHYEYLYIEPEFMANPLNFDKDHVNWMINEGYKQVKNMFNNGN